MIGAYIKNYGGDEEAVLNKSYRNIVMYNAVLPSYDYKSSEKGKGVKINASDPKNREAAHKIMFG